MNYHRPIIILPQITHLTCLWRDHPSGPSRKQKADNIVQGVVRLVGYGLQPFGPAEQGALQVALNDVLPNIAGQVRADAIYISTMWSYTLNIDLNI